MDIGDIGILIIAFIVYLVNFIVKANKDKVAKQTEKQSPVKEDLPEPWEIGETPPPLFDIPIPSKREYKKKKKSSKSFDSILDSVETIENQMQPAQEERISSMSESLFKQDNMDSVSYQDDETEEDVSYTNELFHGNITEELKKAIIYSEILNRKYE